MKLVNICLQAIASVSITNCMETSCSKANTIPVAVQKINATVVSRRVLHDDELIRFTAVRNFLNLKGSDLHGERQELKCQSSKDESCYFLEGIPFCFNGNNSSFRLPDGTTGTFETGNWTDPFGRTGNFFSAEHPANEAGKADPSAPSPRETPDASSVTPVNDGQNATLQTTCTKISLATAASAAVQATYPANKTSNFTFAASNVWISAPTGILTPSSSAHVTASLGGIWPPHLIGAGIAIIVELGFFSLL